MLSVLILISHTHTYIIYDNINTQKHLVLEADNIQI